MRKVRHKNVVQFIGACTRKPNLCIVVEYMPGGSVYDYMRRVSAAPPLQPTWRSPPSADAACTNMYWASTASTCRGSL